MIQFTVTGVPEPQGSARAFLPPGWNRPVITSDNPDLKKYRQTVAAAALIAMNLTGTVLTPEAVEVDITFYFEKPKSLSKKTYHKTTKPDVDKLLRAILDSLTGIVYQDDAQVTDAHARKRFSTPARAEIAVRLTPCDRELPLFAETHHEEVLTVG